MAAEEEHEILIQNTSEAILNFHVAARTFGDRECPLSEMPGVATGLLGALTSRSYPSASMLSKGQGAPSVASKREENVHKQPKQDQDLIATLARCKC